MELFQPIWTAFRIKPRGRGGAYEDMSQKHKNNLKIGIRVLLLFGIAHPMIH